MKAPENHLRPSDIRRRFDRVAHVFDDASFVHRETCERLFERMAPLAVEPRVVLDVGCATGAGSRLLARRFRKATVLSVDLSHAMLQTARKKRSRFSGIREVQADAQCIPLPDQSVDLVFANLLLPWIDDIAVLFGEVARVLGKNGALAFASLGPDSFSELRDAWLPGDGGHHVRAFPDMHDIGDALIHSGLAEPVLDVDRLTVTYGSPDKLLKDIAASGSGNCLANRHSTMTGRRRFEAMLDRLGEGQIALDLELVFGHAWGRGARPPAGEFRIEPGSIGRIGRP